MSEGRNCSSCFWASERQSDRTEGTEHVQSGCYINMFTGLAQCGTPLRPSTRPHCGNEERFFLWSNDGDIQRSNKEQILVTHRAVMETHSVQQDTWTIYSVSILIWLFIKLLFSLSFSNSGAGWIPNLRYPEKIWWISWSFFPPNIYWRFHIDQVHKNQKLSGGFPGLSATSQALHQYTPFVQF